ncbi:MAG: hypothetical protein ABA06_02300 [Parcubacteria bacterium C7867-001]|nr:MAG: hypothetical protein ABA06_02300 [Parcubacteria bacterium C7867-001]
METLSKLFSSAARLKLLRLFLFNDDTAFSAKDAAFRAKVSLSQARKELALLVSAGVLKKRTVQSRTLFTTNRRIGVYDALQRFVRDTTEISDARIISNLKKAGTLRQITLTGVFTGALEPKVDILVIGDRLDDRVLSTAVHALEAELGRELRYASFTSQDFRYRVGVYDRLVRDVFDYAHRTVFEKSSLS